jgi:translation initiation factor 1A
MVRNSGKGGSGHKKLKNSTTDNKDTRELVFKEHGQDYALIMDMLGSGRCKAMCSSDETERLCIIRGSLRKKRTHFIRRNDIVLVSLREYQDGKADIIHVYSNEEVRMLINYEEISQKFVIPLSYSQTYKDTQEVKDDENVVFEDI